MKYFRETRRQFNQIHGIVRDSRDQIARSIEGGGDAVDNPGLEASMMMLSAGAIVTMLWLLALLTITAMLVWLWIFIEIILAIIGAF